MSVTLDARLQSATSVEANNAPQSVSSENGGDQSLKVGTYNVGAGNDEARGNFDDTSRHIADKFTGDDPIDVLALGSGCRHGSHR